MAHSINGLYHQAKQTLPEWQQCAPTVFI